MNGVFQRVLAALGLIVISPVLIVAAVLILIETGRPWLFRQERVGRAGSRFQLFKLRSMYPAQPGPQITGAADVRVTPFGKMLRRYKVDELPQLWNVLRGDMGFVGPRPERPEFVPWLSEQIPYFDLRHMIRPGLTGWAQVRYGYGASLAETREKLEFDLYYIKHMSLGLDLLIMFETIKTIIRRRGAQ